MPGGLLDRGDRRDLAAQSCWAARGIREE